MIAWYAATLEHETIGIAMGDSRVKDFADALIGNVQAGLNRQLPHREKIYSVWPKASSNRANTPIKTHVNVWHAIPYVNSVIPNVFWFDCHKSSAWPIYRCPNCWRSVGLLLRTTCAKAAFSNNSGTFTANVRCYEYRCQAQTSNQAANRKLFNRMEWKPWTAAVNEFLQDALEHHAVSAWSRQLISKFKRTTESKSMF